VKTILGYRAKGRDVIGGMKGIISGMDLLSIRLFLGPGTTILALKTPISGGLIMNSQELTVQKRGRRSKSSKLLLGTSTMAIRTER
jgi:hypothetical protein